MKVTIEHNGKKIDVELTAEQVKELGLQEEKKTGWERADSNQLYGANPNKSYTYINGCMKLAQQMDYDRTEDYERYQQGNYFTNSNLAEKMLKRVRLMLKMQRWADEHNEPLDWDNSDTLKYRISYNTVNKLRVTYDIASKLVGVIYFSSNEIAEAAIKEFGDEIIECYVESEVTR